MAAPAIGVRRRWAARPFASLDTSHPLSNGLVSFATPAGSTFFDIPQGVLLTRLGSLNFGFASVATGQAAAITGGLSDTRWEWPSSNWLPRSNLSILLVHRKTDSTNRASVVFGAYSAPNQTDRCSVHLPFSDGNIYWDHGGAAESTGGGRLKLTGASGFQDANVWLFTAGEASGPQSIWRNGARVAYSADRAAAQSTGSTFCLGNGNSTNTSLVGSDVVAIGGFAVWNRVLRDTEAALVTTDPFCMLRF